MTRIAGGPAPSNHDTVETSVGNPTGALSEVRVQTAPVAAPRTLPSDVGVDRPVPQLRTALTNQSIDVGLLRRDLLGWEGSKPFMYVDTRGFVTTGIGSKLSSAQEATALPWQHKNTGLAATPTEIRAAFENVQTKYAEFRLANPDARRSAGAGYYENASDLVLPPDKVTELANSRIEDFLKSLRRLFPGFDGYPVPAQRALVDMVYTLGAKGLERKFPTVVAACRGGAFSRAAKFCHRKAQANEHRSADARNASTRDLFIEADRLTTTVGRLAREVRP